MTTEPVDASLAATVICGRCGQEPRQDRECLDGWIEVEPLAPGYSPAMARCKRWEAVLEASRHAAGLTASGLDDGAYTASWEALDLGHKSWKAARNIAEHVREVVSQGLNLVFTGPTGTGKTHAGVLICRAAVAAGLSVVKQDWSRFLDALKDGYNDRSQEPEGKRLERLVGADLLMLDDIGAGGEDNKYSSSRLEKVIARRYDAHRPTLLTANFTPQAMRELLGDRAASRIQGRVMTVVFDGPAHRAQTERREVSDLVSRLWRAS